MPKKLPMVGWYDPRMLVRTGIRVSVSTAFGQFADKREAIAAANAVEPQPFDDSFDYAKKHRGRDFWFDYLADTGDGWNPTYAMARLVTEESLKLEDDKELPRGSLLLFGGDQVYPTASRKAYHERFLGPFEEAYAPNGVKRWPDEPQKGNEASVPDLYAIPGNHDWYDGLNAFFGLFCRRRVTPCGKLGVSRPGRIIAGRQTQQTRSYFALKLPGDWWLWGTDSQLEGYIDQPQVDFFHFAATSWMKAGSKLILCVADPSWAYVDPQRPEKRFESFAYIERLAWTAKKDADDRPRRHQLKLVLTGDSHHYARYVEDDRHYIVCGGGGAFLHPTHHLQDKVFEFDHPKPGQAGEGCSRREFRIARSAKDDNLQAIFPDRDTSRRLAYRNLVFPWLNRSFVAALLGAYAIFNWLLNANAKILWESDLVGMLRQENWQEALYAYVALIFTSPWPIIVMAAAWGGCYYLADARTKSGRVLMGTLHWAAQVLAVALTTCAVLRWSEGLFGAGWDNFFSVSLATVVSAIVSAIVFGCYLLISLNSFGRHANEAFSSLRIEGYKSFLRLRIQEDGRLTIFPIGLKSVPNHYGGSSENPADNVQLIEPPIEIPPRQDGAD